MNDLQLRGKNEYLINVIKEGKNNIFFDIHAHLEVITIYPYKRNFSYIKIPEIFVYNTKEKKCIFLYIMMAMEEDKNIQPLGGIYMSTLVEKGDFRGINDNNWYLPKDYLEKSLYYDGISYDTEKQKKYLMDEKQQQQQTKPFDLYLNFPDPIQFSSLITTINSKIDPIKLIERRYNVLKSVSHNTHQQKKISNQQLLLNYQYIVDEILFEKDEDEFELLSSHLSNDNDSMVIENYDNTNKQEQWRTKVEPTSYWLFQKYVSFICSLNSPSRKWIAQQEERIMKFRLERQYQTETDILQLLNYNGLINTQSISNSIIFLEINLEYEIKLQCEDLFRAHFSEFTIPTVWFSVLAIESLELGLESLEGSKTVIEKGRCYLSYKHLQCDYLPKLLSSLILNGYSNISNQQHLSNQNEKQKIELIGEEICKKISENLTRSLIDLSYIDTFGLPDIENDTTASSFPLCKFMLHKTLLEKKHLKCDERYQYASFLLDIGYKKSQVEKHLRKYFSKGETTEEKFTSKYMHALNYNEKGKWENGKRIQSYGMGCQKLSSNNTNFNVGNKVGCPFNSKLIKKEELKKLIIESTENKITENIIEEILYESTLENHTGACALYFKAKYGILPQPKNGSFEWRPGLPQNYFNQSLNQQNTKRHFDIMYDN